ncbi:MAG TPA: hypothetical protein VLZ10_02195 [Thermodesulfobacteriota bacterium]|nr:hypothetical protein [Thermodesulfobacteriota bacterium]
MWVDEKRLGIDRNIMVRLDQPEGRYRVLLMGVGSNTEAEKDSFCHVISKNYSVPFLQLKKIVNRCPVILKKNLSLKKAALLAKTLKSFGASLSIEERRESPPISLEFQELAPHRLALESCFFRRSQTGTWSVTGRAKNISDETLSDIWVLVQVFEDFEEFVAFEEAPLPINPLPSGQASPFKVVFEGAFSIKKISVGFKDASGQAVPAADKRKWKEWVKVDPGEGHSLSSREIPTVLGEKSEGADLAGPPERMILDKEDEILGDIPLSSEKEVAPLSGDGRKENYGEVGGVSGGSILFPLEPSKKITEFPLILVKEDDSLGRRQSESALSQGMSDDCALPVSNELGGKIGAVLDGSGVVSDKAKQSEESRLNPLVFQEATQLLKDISENPKAGETEEKIAPSLSWIESFRDAVKTFYQTPHDIFSIWFEECRKKGEFRNFLHGILTILVHSRFDQGTQSNNPLENTQKIFPLIAQPNLPLDEMPSLEGTSFASGEVWRNLLQRALPKVHQIGQAILEKNKWNVSDLERLIQVIPHMGIRNSRMAIRWISELMPNIAEIDFSSTPIIIGEGLYRVAARLGIVDPHLDYYNGRNLMGDTKIQSFAIKTFPQNPVRLEKPMMWVGDGEERGGHCFPVQPWCNGCLFETFCPRLYLDFDPSEKGLRD